MLGTQTIIPVTNVYVDKGPWIVVEEIEDGIFKIVGNNFTNDINPNVGMVVWDIEVSNRDRSSPAMVAHISHYLLWMDVHLRMLEEKEGYDLVFDAPSIERLIEALGHVTFGAWNPRDI